MLSGPSAWLPVARSMPLTVTWLPALNDPGPRKLPVPPPPPPPPPPRPPPLPPPPLKSGILNVVSTLAADSAPLAAATPFSFEIVVTAESFRLPRLRVALSSSSLTVAPGLTKSRVIMPARPMAATSISARRQTPGRS